jgi:hypothetical protein
VRVLEELLRPGVQNRHHADSGADVAPITGQLDNGFRGRFHERGVAVALVGAQHFAQLRRHGDRDMEVGTRQQLGLARCDPALGLILMASRAAAVFAALFPEIVRLRRKAQKPLPRTRLKAVLRQI